MRKSYGRIALGAGVQPVAAEQTSTWDQEREDLPKMCRPGF